MLSSDWSIRDVLTVAKPRGAVFVSNIASA
jgi:hypothetical protein